MNKFILLLLVIGVAVWFNRETVSGWIAQKSGNATETEEPETKEPASPVNPVKSPATPNPAPEATAQAIRTYPALANAGSAFNLRFVALHNQMKASNPDFLAATNWPLQLAERTAKELGGGAVPRPGNRGITGWTDNYAEAVESAKLDDKKLLLDFTGSDWCGYCMALEKEVLSTPKFHAWAHQNVVLVRLDFPKNRLQSTRVKEQNAALEARYPFNGYPTIMILDTTGRKLGGYSGYDPGSGPDAYIAKLENTVRR